MKLIKEPNRCFSCGRGNVNMHKDKVKVNGKPEHICEECFNIYSQSD